MATTSPPTAPATSANPETWTESQRYELEFWKSRWPYRDLPIDQLQELRLRDANWFLQSLGFARTSERAFEGFTGSVLEVGCGPIGFFELVEGVRVTANDSLMAAYAKEIPFSLLGTRGSTTYVSEDVKHITGQFRFVVCSNVLDHTADWLEFLELLASRVEPGGELLLFTDTRGAPAVGHTQVFTPGQVIRALRLLGLANVKFQKTVPPHDDHCDQRFFLRAAR